MNYEILIVGPLETNCYLVYSQDSLECTVVDPGAEADRIFQLIAQKNLKPKLILNTHGHVDHIGANKEIKEKFDIPLCIHSSDSPMLEKVQQSELCFFLGAKNSPPADRFLQEDDKIEIGNSFLRVIHTPGLSLGRSWCISKNMSSHSVAIALSIPYLTLSDTARTRDWPRPETASAL